MINSTQCKNKFTEEQIQQLQELYSTGDWTQKRLAEKFGVAEHQIKKALKGIVKPRPTIYQRFEAKRVEEENGCHVWIASTDKDGYGWFRTNGKSLRSHQASYQLYKGEIPKGKKVRHICDNPSCVNPDHLILGTQKQNNQDKIDRYRQPWQYNASEYLEMRCMNQIGLSENEIAERYGIKMNTLKSRLKDMAKTSDDPFEDNVFYYRDRAIHEEAEKYKDSKPMEIVIDRIIE
ncbi:HNH endonuclease [Neobacillus drentensis]|uniref:HNH endonuclease n=1 Tax=Neobacillus drentensis TaxID=220684 RepID=UPI002FFEE147